MIDKDAVKDAIKENLNTYRLWSTYTITIDTACIAWFISNHSKEARLVVIYDMLVIVVLSALLIYLNAEVYRFNKLMEKLNEF